MSSVKTPAFVLSSLGIALILALILASFIGTVPISLLSLLSGNLSASEETILSLIRLPRVLLAGIVGASLAVSGAAMQGLFRNPLADPALIGISAGAAFAVAIAIVLTGSTAGVLGLYGISVVAFIGGLTASLFIYYFSQLSGTFSVTYMLLAGIAINALAGAGTGFLTFLSSNEQLRALTFWAMGSLDGASWPLVLVTATLCIPIILILTRCARQLNILLLGESEAQYLGVNSKRLKLVIIISVALSVGAAVAVSGIIGFVGLVVPHLVRLSLGPDHRLLIPASALLGAILLVVADTAARAVIPPTEIPVGILTSLIGGPFFLWLLFKQYARKFST